MISADYFIKHTSLSSKETSLLRLSLAQSVTQAELDTLLAGYDMDAEPIHFNLVLAHLSKKHPELNFPGEIKPRLSGVLRYFLYHNTTLGAAFREVATEMRRNDIPVLMMKGIAMKYLRPGSTRAMFDVDFAVPPDQLDEAVRLALNMGFKNTHARPLSHSVDLLKAPNIALDIHRFLTKNEQHKTAVTDRAIWSRATQVTAFGAVVLMPTPEDLLFLLLVNAYHNICHLHNFHGNFMWLFDCAHILREKPDFNWDIVIDNAEKNGQSYQLRVMLELFRHFLPAQQFHAPLPEINIKPQQQQTARLALQWDILHNKITRVRHYRQKLRLFHSANWAEVVFWTKIRTQYRFLRTVQKNSMASHLLLDLVTRQ